MAEKAKYIDVKELSIILDTMKNPDSEFATDDYIDGFSDGISAVIKELEIMPAIDVAEVVRCRDCKYYDKKYHQCKLHSEEPDQYSTGFIFNMQEDDFCSYGERIVSNEVE